MNNNAKNTTNKYQNIACNAIKLIPPRTKEQTEKAKAHAEKVGLGKKDG